MPRVLIGAATIRSVQGPFRDVLREAGFEIVLPAMARQMTEDELFVSAGAAEAGVRIENLSSSDPLVILKHFGPGNPENPKR